MASTTGSPAPHLRPAQAGGNFNLKMEQNPTLKRSIETIDLTSPRPTAFGREYKRAKITTVKDRKARATKTNELPTPPSTAKSERHISQAPMVKGTVKLSLVIPQSPPPDAKKKRRIAACKAADTRFKYKLQLPLPSEKEISKARPLKLLQHYGGPKKDQMEPTPIRPKIETSQRVTNLLKQFPKLDTCVAIPAGDTVRTPQGLRLNRETTESDEVQRSAWSNFSHPHFTTRYAMAQSGLLTDDLKKEGRGIENDLPEWRKRHTSHHKYEQTVAAQEERPVRVMKATTVKGVEKKRKQAERNAQLLKEEQRKIKEIEKKLQRFKEANASD